MAINIDSEMLYSGRNYKSNKSNHTTILVGRRYNHTKKQCEYLLRDSLSTIPCDKRISIECELDVVSGAVDYWIPRTTLKNNLSRVYKVTPQ